MSGNMRTTTDEMLLASKHVMDVNNGVQGELRTLQSKLAPLSGLWTGLAAAEFARLMARWDAGARSLNEALSSIGTAILTSGQSYEQNEDQQRQSMSSIGAVLG